MVTGYRLGSKNSCLSLYEDEYGTHPVCATNLFLGFSLGLNLWGEGFDFEGLEAERSAEAKYARREKSESSGWGGGLNFGGDLGALVVIIAASFMVASVYSAIAYPFSSRVDAGMSIEVEKLGYDDTPFSFEDHFLGGVGLWSLIYPSQRIPFYFISESIIKKDLEDGSLKHLLFQRFFGVGFMSPKDFGLFVQSKFEDAAFVSPHLFDPAKENIEKISGEKEFLPDVGSLSIEVGVRSKF